MIVKPTVWGRQARLRFSNTFGTKPLRLDGVFVGLQASGANVVPATSHRVTVGRQPLFEIAPGQSVWTDAVDLHFVTDPNAVDLQGRKLAVTFHVLGESGPMTWHAKALTTSYLGAPGDRPAHVEESESGFPFSTTSWFFLDALDMMMPPDTRAVVAFGDSITDGTGTTLNGDDRWSDVLARRLYREYGNTVSVVNAGIGGNQIAGPARYSAGEPFAGGPSAGDRLERDVLSLSGVSTVIWLEGINDLGRSGNQPAASIAARMREIVGRIRARLPGVRIVGGTVVSALNSTNASHGTPEQDTQRRELNTFIRTSGVFDAVVDFDAATLDPSNGQLRAEFVPDSTSGGPGDRLHPNRAGYQAMGQAVDLSVLGLGAPRR
jgi:lysophospholipase L1-like esterase